MQRISGTKPFLEMSIIMHSVTSRAIMSEKQEDTLVHSGISIIQGLPLNSQ